MESIGSGQQGANNYGILHEQVKEPSEIVLSTMEEVHTFLVGHGDDKFSQEVFKKYLGEVDAEKRIFIKGDIVDLSKYEKNLDNEILGQAPVEFVPAVVVIFKKRLA